MKPLLQGSLIEDFRGRPSPGSFIDCAHIKDPIMQMLNDRVKRWLSEKGFIGVHAIAGQYAYSGPWNILFNVRKETLGSFFSCCGRVDRRLGET